jgi:hypothetical protein
VEAHGGKLWAENNADGKGATFSFSLPIRNIITTNNNKPIPKTEEIQSRKTLTLNDN